MKLIERIKAVLGKRTRLPDPITEAARQQLHNRLDEASGRMDLVLVRLREREEAPAQRVLLRVVKK